MMRRRRRAQRGFTLIELMVSLVLFSLVTAGMLSVAITMARGFSDQEATVATETSVRATLDYLADALRNSSPGVQTGKIINLDAGCANTDTLSMTQNVATPFANTSDQLTVLYASGSVSTMTTSLFSGAGVLNVADGTQFENDDYAVITDFATGYFVHIDNHTAVSITVSNAACAFTPLTAGAYVIKARKATFTIGTFLADDNVTNMPVLMMDGDAEGPRETAQPFAEGVEDIELVIGADTDVNGAVNNEGVPSNAGDEWYGNDSGDAIPPNPIASIRAARLSIVARTARSLDGRNNYILGALEDRAANAASDDFRRRTLTTTVEIRNMGGSP